MRRISTEIDKMKNSVSTRILRVIRVRFPADSY